MSENYVSWSVEKTDRGVQVTVEMTDGVRTQETLACLTFDCRKDQELRPILDQVGSTNSLRCFYSLFQES